MTESKNPAVKRDKPIDFSLVIRLLEEKFIKGEQTDRWKRILLKENIWKNLSTSLQIKWARIAQIAGEVELALRIFTHINKKEPTLINAWEEHVQLLSILGEKKRLAQLIALSRRYLSPDRSDMLLALARQKIPDSIGENDIPPDPFQRLRNREESIRRFLELFSGREDCFARQWANREENTQGYVPVRRPMTPEDVEEHLSGKKTFGLYLLRKDSTVKVAVIDADIIPEFRKTKISKDEKTLIKRERLYLFKRINELSKDAGFNPVAEFSGAKGYHFWFFLEEPVNATLIRQALNPIARILNKDLQVFRLESFPKQDNLSGKGFGNLVKLPLGIHRLTGKRSFFMDCPRRDLDSQLAFLRKIKMTGKEDIRIHDCSKDSNRIIIHPRMKNISGEYPELVTLEATCPPIGQIISSCINRHPISSIEEKILIQTIGFLPASKRLIHYLLSNQPEYNPHLVDYKLSRLRGKPLGCKRIHSLMKYGGDFCPFNRISEYPHPLLHLKEWKEELSINSEKITNLESALENLKLAIIKTEAFLK